MLKIIELHRKYNKVHDLFESVMLAQKLPQFDGKITLKYDPSRVKKDVLYKPLLRIFRNAIKEFFGDSGEGI